MINSKEKTKAVIFIAEGFEEIEAVTVVDILRRAEINIETVSIMDSREVMGAHGIALLCDSLFDAAASTISEAEALILPGGGEGTKNLKKHLGLKNALINFNENRKLIAAICAAPSVLGSNGILEGRAAVCFPGFEKELNCAEIGAEEVVVSENIITAKAAGAASEFAFKIVETLISASGLDGRKIADKLRGQMFY